MGRHLAYLRYVLVHKWYVFIACLRTGAGLWRGLVHDLSKFRPDEWLPYARSFYAADGTQKYQPDPEFNAAWLCHQHRNPHHWQHWLLVQDDDPPVTLPMPEVYVREMVADWIGASRAQTGRDNTRQWYANHAGKMQLAPETRELVIGIITDVCAVPEGAETRRAP